MERFCIIGGGASGIAAGKCLRQNNKEFDIYESGKKFGGNWAFGQETGRVYENVHLISSKRNTQFSDFPMPKEYPDYPGHQLFYQYLLSVAEKFELSRNTFFETVISKIEPLGNQWEVTTSAGDRKRYDGVFVCNGLLRKPILPTIASKFAGESLHSADYLGEKQFRGKRVLVVGGGNSGSDIAADAAMYAEYACHSMRRGYYFMPKFINGKPTQEWLMEISPSFNTAESYWEHVKQTLKIAGFDGTDFGLMEPDHDIDAAHPILNSQLLYHVGHGNVDIKPDVREIEGQSVEFSDGSREEFDLIVWATGFKVDLPFIDKKVVDWTNGLSDLFLQMIPKKYDNLFFMGYVNSPSGFGNLANTAANFLMTYLEAKEKDGHNWQVLQGVKGRWKELDMGQNRFMKTGRHVHELDLWQYIKTLNFLRSKLSA